MDFLEFIRKVHKERKQRWIAKHYGPGPHPGTGTPQSVHGGKGKKGKRQVREKKGKGSARQAAAAAISGKSLSEFSTEALTSAIDRIENIARAQSKQARHIYGRVHAYGKYASPQQALTPAIDKIYAELARRKEKPRITGKRKRKQPPDMSKWSQKQHQKAINELAKKPLKELRRRQDLVASQRKQALQQLKATKDSTIKQRLERGLRNLEVMDKHLIAAIDKKEFG